MNLCARHNTEGVLRIAVISTLEDGAELGLPTGGFPRVIVDTVEVGSMNLIEFLSWHVNATIGST